MLPLLEVLVSQLVLRYHPVRGGFLLQLSPFDRSVNQKLSFCEGFVDAYLSPEQRVVAIESSWTNGGLYLHDLQGTNLLAGKFEADGATNEIKGGASFVLRQDEDIFSLWFTAPPTIGGPPFLCQKEGGIRTSLWFSSQWRPLYSPKDKPKVASKSELLKGDTSRAVAGIQMKFSSAAVSYPIQSIEMSAET
jgi:hypothetical protein